MLLDPFIIQAVSGITADQIYEAWLILYPEYAVEERDADQERNDVVASIDVWLGRVRKKPGAALSTGRRNSFRGELTCALLHVLHVPAPKTARVRMDVAWSILNSAIGRANVGVAEELESELPAARLRGYGFR